MESSLALLILGAILLAVGVYLILERSLSRIVLGLANITNGVNILFLVAGGRSGEPPIVGSAAPEAMADPLVQAMMLTAIVIGLATTAFLLAMGYRSWQLHGNDEVQDDLEDKRIARRIERQKLAARADLASTVEEDASQTHDDTEGVREDCELIGTIDPILDRPREQYPVKDSWGVS
ncbi:Na(+)/H(+) antiporter subunit C [Arcanobacterium hippocoleae]|uniref:Multicomponent Na+:H+ antiporter subunit C n=1 Tax=Arcanobacterium hippocoleae TaxID=149017 RepID=A0ABU1T494_9ACTO|nr:Na(+)/H(+) antiporter subunit C [Arcanobacterium hippocoleae]MDR6939660.1 multicomponent Na+:H+ antiporter subunit C [Arcanobacterium hippocoleae]